MEAQPSALCTPFCTFGADFHAQSVLSDKISAPELSRKFIKGPLLVGFGSEGPGLIGT